MWSSIIAVAFSIGMGVSGVKMQPLNQDPMYYIGQDWGIKAPDKWQHAYGSYAATKVLYRFTDAAPVIVITGGMVKEVMDVSYLGWSLKDVGMDVLGVSAARLETDKVKFLMEWKDHRILLKVVKILN